MTPPKRPSRRISDRAAAPRPIIHAIQVYDGEKFGFPLAVFEGTGQFQDIGKGDTLDGGDWPPINGHTHYAKIYRITAIRHTLTTSADGSVKHLKSLFVEPVVSRPKRPG